MPHQLTRITSVRPWCDLEQPDSRVIFRAASGGWLLFHTTTCEAADDILVHGFQDNTCRIGFQGRSGTHAVYFGGVPAIPVSIDYFDARVMEAASIAWIVIEAPPDAWPHAAVSHQQDPTWPLYQVCYRAAQVNAWPRRRLPVEDVLDFRPSLVVQQLEDLEEAVQEGWLDPGILRRVKSAASRSRGGAMTHYIPPGIERVGRQERAFCGALVSPRDFSTEPQCVECARLLVQDAAALAALEARPPSTSPDPGAGAPVTRE